MGSETRLKSRTIFLGRDRAPARSYLKAIGFDDEASSKPIIGVAHTWIETMSCNFNQRRLAERIEEGIREAGGTPMELNTIAISDGVTRDRANNRATPKRSPGCQKTGHQTPRAALHVESEG